MRSSLVIVYSLAFWVLKFTAVRTHDASMINDKKIVSTLACPPRLVLIFLLSNLEAWVNIYALHGVTLRALQPCCASRRNSNPLMLAGYTSGFTRHVGFTLFLLV